MVNTYRYILLLTYTLGGILRREPPSCEAPRQPTIYPPYMRVTKRYKHKKRNWLSDLKTSSIVILTTGDGGRYKTQTIK